MSELWYKKLQLPFIFLFSGGIKLIFNVNVELWEKVNFKLMYHESEL